MRTGTVANSHYIRGNLVSSNALQVSDYLNIVVCLILLPSAIVHGLLGINEKTAFMILAPIIVVWALIVNRFIVKTIFKMSISMVYIGVVGSLVASAYSQLLIGSTFAISIMAGYELCKTLQKPPALRAVTFFTLILLAGGVVGLLYSYLGKSPLLDVKIGYRTTYLYLTTFSFAHIGNFIRPSGIFDEPGAFAMYAALITIVNDLLNQNRYLNFAILTLMVFTGSIAGLIIIVLYLLLSNAVRYYRKGILLGISLLAAAYAFMIFFVNPDPSLTRALDTFYTDRLQVVDGRLVGDNRSSQIEEFFDLVDEDMMILGAKNTSKKYGQLDQSSNPFSIVFGYGLIISLPYFGLLLWLLSVTIKNRFHNSYASLGLFALLLQRPYLFNMMWSIMICAVIWLLYYDSRNRMLKQRKIKRKLSCTSALWKRGF